MPGNKHTRLPDSLLVYGKCTLSYPQLVHLHRCYRLAVGLPPGPANWAMLADVAYPILGRQYRQDVWNFNNNGY